MRTRTAIAAGAGVAGALLWASYDIPAGYGAHPSGERLERIRRSPQFRGGSFVNERPTHLAIRPEEERHWIREVIFDRSIRKPADAIPLYRRPGPEATVPADLAITWYGHASALVEIDGATVLFDPVWSDRCSPSRLFGPHRLHRTPIPVRALPRIDAVVISHDHYDHLDMHTILDLLELQECVFVVPLGVGAHLERWRVPASRIVELDWGEESTVAGLRLICSPAQHFSGRAMHQRNYTLWCSWIVLGPRKRIYYTGDTGYFGGFARIGAEHGPFDAALVQVGAYDAFWPDIHMTPEEAVQAHLDARGGLLVPVHWATFTLAFHAWAEPADRLWREAKARDVPVTIPRIGERIDVAAPPPVDPWWAGL